MNKVAVICYHYGMWPEDQPVLGEKYVQRLRSSVYRNAVTPHDFITIGDKGWCDVQLPARWMGLRWNLKKMYMFSEESGLRQYEWVVCLDLDLVITGIVDFLLLHRSPHLITCRGAYSSHKPGGSVVAFGPGQPWCDKLVGFLWGSREAVEKETRGSERRYYHMMIGAGEVRYWQDLYPGTVNSYKVDGYTNGASIVRFHGKPRPHQVEDAWVKEYWR